MKKRYIIQLYATNPTLIYSISSWFIISKFMLCWPELIESTWPFSSRQYSLHLRMLKLFNFLRCKMPSLVSLTRQVIFIILLNVFICLLPISINRVICLCYHKNCAQAKEDKFRNRVKRYVGIWCCVMNHTPGHIYYDMYWDEKPGWKPIPPQTSEEDHPPWWVLIYNYI